MLTVYPTPVLDQLLAGADPKTAFDPNGLIDDLKRALADRVLNAEMDHHLAGEEPGNDEMVMERRRSSPTPARSNWRCRATARPVSIRS
jgi:transposase-like protein